MPITLAALLAAASVSAGPANLDFSAGKLTGWEGDGFAVVAAASGKAASSEAALGRAILHRTFVVPAGATALHFTATAVRPNGAAPGGMLEVVLEAANREMLPRQVRDEEGWADSPQLLPPVKGKPREYRFDLGGHAGRRVRLALVDSDERPGCYLIAGGFRLATRDGSNARQFADDMRKLQQEHALPRLLRYDSKHFLALSNADPGYSEYRLYNCETIHGLFFEHFRKRGFPATPPAEKMMVAIFSTPEGFEAYLGQKMSASVTGVYHTPSNRLVVYDYGKNKFFLEGKKHADEAAKGGSTDLEREHRSLAFGRHIRDRRDDTNISTIMHEVAHQLSFNCGMLNRSGDVPAWLAEGLAVYCESTVKGAWQGIGEPNPQRTGVLARQLGAGGELFPLRALVANDDWLRKAPQVNQVVLGYSQSWALFRLLMDQRPKQLRAYLQAIHPRRTPEHRLADFAGAFGSDLAKLDKLYQAYMRDIARKEAANEPRTK
jgi:hypothetical protein